MSQITVEQAASDYGVHCNHQVMPNGERRFRLTGEDGSGYIKTCTGKTGGWQNSHWHRSITEIYIVQQGWLVMAYPEGKQCRLEHHLPGDIIQVLPNIRHNTFLSADAVIHVVKLNIPADGDWVPDADLDTLTKEISEASIRQQFINVSADK